ncbi:hypothetical protein N657DRAFT_661943 [Parathielavia appendiculata]|uniref:Mediator of RNA polymerase II transcription subunit 11 n=1 Tax=Parathielavia appendiculata TaxID=2587402 RepID=A0AAN6U7Q3_9PEZI|nr:hypothetical protein N657DRAFT_661943 [Parathielavia appendiculata]
MNNPSEQHALNGTNGAGAIDIHTPFTASERIQQLSEIDDDIAALLTHISSAMRALATPPPDTAQTPDQTPGSDAPIGESEAAAGDPVSAFKTAQSAFFRTIDRIDKQLTRQILALEEAGIITLRSTGAGAPAGAEGDAGSSQPQQSSAGGGEAARARSAPARLEPDGMGRYGTLDVGKLNMASSTVERDMERDLWRRAREELIRLVQSSGKGGAEDKMEE